MSENAEIKARVLDWQRRFNIQDGDPAMALIELLDIYGTGSPAPRAVAPAGDAQPIAVDGMDDAIAEQFRAQLLPAIERLGFQTQELKQKIEEMSLETFAQQVATYHEGIDYCTKKLDVVKKEADSITVQLAKVSSSINPITRTAVIVLMLVSGVVGFIIALAAFR
jgi:hypothetical protein